MVMKTASGHGSWTCVHLLTCTQSRTVARTFRTGKTQAVSLWLLASRCVVIDSLCYGSHSLILQRMTQHCGGRTRPSIFAELFVAANSGLVTCVLIFPGPGGCLRSTEYDERHSSGSCCAVLSLCWHHARLQTQALNGLIPLVCFFAEQIVL